MKKIDVTKEDYKKVEKLRNYVAEHYEVHATAVNDIHILLHIVKTDSLNNSHLQNVIDCELPLETDLSNIDQVLRVELGYTDDDFEKLKKVSEKGFDKCTKKINQILSSR